MSKYPINKDGKPVVPWEDLDLTRVSPNRNSAIKCPNCADERKKKGMKSMQVHVVKGVANCHHCQAVSYKKTTENVRRQPKEYAKPPENITSLSQAVVDWFRDERAILQNTLNQWKITEAPRFFPQIQEKKKAIVFPYYVDSELINNKYRSRDKDFIMESGAKLVLYGIDNLKSQTTGVICEGEIDALTIWQCGIHNVVSVPNGVGGISKDEIKLFEETGKFDTDRPLNLEFLDNSYENIKHIENWIIWTDTDLPGLKLRTELIRRFGAENCKIVDSGEFKDANEVLLGDGMQKVQELIATARDCEIEGVVEESLIEEYIKNLKLYGVERGLETPIEEFNKHYRPKLAELDIVTGTANHGKTYYEMWYCILISSLYDWKWCLYMPENAPAARVVKTLIEILVGKKFEYIKEDYIDLAVSWVNQHFVIIDFDEKIVTMDDLLVTFAQVVKSKGVHGFVVDPLNDLHHDYSGKSIDQYYQAMLSDIRRFKKKHNCKFILSAHPHTHATREKEEHYEQGPRPKVIEIPDITGGNIFHNRADNGISIYRNLWSEDPTVIRTTEVHVQKIKFQDEVGTPTPKTRPILLVFDLDKRRYKDVRGNDPLDNYFQDKVVKPIFGEQQKTWKSHDELMSDFEEDDIPF